MNNYSDQQLPINFNNYNQFQNDESLHSSHPSTTSTSTSSSSYNLTPDKQPNTIKERLNLHVKRKILENTTTAGNCTVTSQQYQQLNQERSNDNLTKSPNTVNNPSTSDTTNAIIPKRKRKTKKTLTTATTTKNINVNRTGGNGDDSQDDNLSCIDTNRNLISTSSATATSSKNKDNKKEPDILAQILNQKKLALMRDPEIIELFNRMTKKLENNKNNSNQVYQS